MLLEELGLITITPWSPHKMHLKKDIVLLPTAQLMQSFMASVIDPGN
jgi:hypothetical protein